MCVYVCGKARWRLDRADAFALFTEAKRAVLTMREEVSSRSRETEQGLKDKKQSALQELALFNLYKAPN